jgi:hypothetical protein
MRTSFAEPTERVNGRRPTLLVAAGAAILIVAAAGFAVAANQRDEPPVVTIDSSIREQIAALEFHIDEETRELADVGRNSTEIREAAIASMEEKIAELCAELNPSEAADVQSCQATG